MSTDSSGVMVTEHPSGVTREWGDGSTPYIETPEMATILEAVWPECMPKHITGFALHFHGATAAPEITITRYIRRDEIPRLTVLLEQFALVKVSEVATPIVDKVWPEKPAQVRGPWDGVSWLFPRSLITDTPSSTEAQQKPDETHVGHV